MEIDTQEVLQNLDQICKSNKFTYEEHTYLQAGLKAIKAQLDELKKLKEEKKETK